MPFVIHQTFSWDHLEKSLLARFKLVTMRSFETEHLAGKQRKEYSNNVENRNLQDQNRTRACRRQLNWFISSDASEPTLDIGTSRQDSLQLLIGTEFSEIVAIEN